MRLIQASGYIKNAVLLICLSLLFISTTMRESPVALICGRPAFFVGGVWMLLDDLFRLRRRQVIEEHGISVIGQLQQLKLSGRWIKPVVKFALGDGTFITVEIPQNINFNWHIISLMRTPERNITLKYNPDKPSEAFIFSSFTVWLAPLLGIVGGLFLCIYAFLPWSS